MNSELLRSSAPLALSPMFYETAALLSGSFVSSERENGESFCLIGSDAPAWILETVREAHFEEFPNDSRYELIRWAAVALADSRFSDKEEAMEAMEELSRDLVPVSSAQILDWFAAIPGRLSDCDEVAEDFDCPNLPVLDLLSLGYKRAAENVLSTLIDAIEENSPAWFNPDTDCKLLLSDAHGVYIPQIYCENISKSEAKEMNLDWWAVETCQHGPEDEFYWEAWQAIESSAEITEDGTPWRLHQNGDLWQVRADKNIPEDWLSC
jgi:hypothetical protein